ncbi:hypothetical protein LEMLEM_LOCUS1460, partial [Lemmus lemmus]
LTAESCRGGESSHHPPPSLGALEGDKSWVSLCNSVCFGEVWP